MNINNLQKGMIIKNYKALCELLEIAPKTGKSKILQHEEFERYFKYSKEGNKYIINEVNKVIEKKIDNRVNNKGGNNNIFADDFRNLLICLMNNEPDECFELPKNLLGKILGLINGNFIEARNKVPKLSEVIGIEEDYIYDFYDENSRKMSDTIERNLNRLRKQALIMHERIMFVNVIDIIVMQNELGKPLLDKNGNVQYIKNRKNREATKDEKQTILRCEKEVLQELQVDDLKHAFLSGKYWEFRKKVQEKLIEKGTGIAFYYEAYKITWNKDYIKEEFDKLEEHIDKQGLEDSLNKKMIMSIIKSTKTRNKKAINTKEEDINIHNIKRIMMRSSNDYIEKQLKLSEVLIDKNAKCIKEELKKETIKNISITQVKQDDNNEEIPF